MNSFRVVNEIKEGSPTRTFSKRQETAVAKTVGGTRTPNSGATLFGGKSDVHIDKLINIECKTKMTKSKSISLKAEWFDKMMKESIFDGTKYSTLAFNFGPDEEMHYVINEELFLILLDALKDANNL